MPPQKIILIRHAEKQVTPPPPFGVGEDGVQDRHSLSARGWQRAGALVAFFASPKRDGIASPTALFATAVAGDELAVEDEDMAKSRRPHQTLTPLSRAMKLPVGTAWTVGQEADLARAVAAGSGITLVAWEHKHLPLIAAAFTDAAPGAWPEDRFDLVWVLDRAGDGYVFTQLDQALLDGDQTSPALR